MDTSDQRPAQASPAAGESAAPFVVSDQTATGDDAPPRSLPPVRVIRSPRRKQTVSARLTDGVLVVRMPASLSDRQQQDALEQVLARFEEKWRCGHVPLAPRARELAARFGLPEPRSIRWSSRQRLRWGSCTAASGDIRISARLASAPPWVLDHVIVHELAHLVVADHSPEFWKLVNQDPNAQRAEGYLLALSDSAPPPRRTVGAAAV